MLRTASSLFILASFLFGAPSVAEEAASGMQSPEAIFETLADQSIEMDEEQIDQADEVIKRAVKASPKDARLVMSQSMILNRRGDSDKAYDVAKKAIKLDPNDAMLQYLFGNAAFAHINNVSIINKGAVAGKGKAAYEKAVELDPSLLEAQVGLANFYTFAPGIAGGSVSKAREIAEAIEQYEGGPAAAASLRMLIEGKEKNWDAYEAATQDAILLAVSDEEQQEVRMQSAMILIFQAEKHQRALDSINAIKAASEASGEPYRVGTLSYLEGVCLRETGDLDGAITCFERTLSVNADAQNTRYSLAECYEERDNYALAAKHYQEFADRFKDDDRAKGAKKKAKKLKKKAAKG